MTPLVEDISVSSTVIRPSPAPTYAGFWVRLKAGLIDCLFFYPICLPIQLKAAWIGGRMPIAYYAGTFILPALITVPFWHAFGATPGKLIASIRIVDARTGGQPRLIQSLNRYFSYIISAIGACLGFMWIGWDRKKRAWHDFLSGTVVIYEAQPGRRRIAIWVTVLSVAFGTVMLGRFALSLGHGKFKEWASESNLAQNAGHLYGAGKTDLACLQTAYQKDVTASTFVEHVNATEFLDGCFQTAERVAQTCQGVPAPSDYKRTTAWSLVTSRQVGRGDPMLAQLLMTLQRHCYPGNEKAAKVQVGETTYLK